MLVTLALGLAWAELASVSAQTAPDDEEVAVSATVPETLVSVVGLTSPGALVVVAAPDMIVGVTPPADEQGRFAESFVLSPQSGIMPGEEVVFTLTAQDKEGRRASPLERRARLMLAANNMLGWAILPPTVELSAAVISPSEALTVSGRGAPDSEVVLSIDGILAGNLVSADAEEGQWERTLTGPSRAGVYRLQAINQDGMGRISEATSVRFEVRAQRTPPGPSGPSVPSRPAPTPVVSPTRTPTPTPRPTATPVPDPVAATRPPHPPLSLCRRKRQSGRPGQYRQLSCPRLSQLPGRSPQPRCLPRKPQGITLSASDFSVERGGVLVYTVQLAARPKSEATVQVSHVGGCSLDLSPGALTFTPDDWNAQQTVTVGVKLGASVGECIINHSDNSGNTADATITVTDSGLRPLPQATLTGVQDTLSLPEGSMFTYTLGVDPRPDGEAVTVMLSSDNDDVEFLGGDGSYVRELTLNYSSATLPRDVTVTAGADSDAEDNPFKVRHRVLGNNIVVVSAIISDNDRIADDHGLGFAVSPSPQSLPEGGQGEYQVRLSARPRGRTVIHFETASAGSIHIRGPCGGARDLTLLTFTTGNWDQPQTVAFNVCGDSDDSDDIFTLTHRVYNDPSCTDFSGDCETLLVGEVRIQVIDDDTSGLTIDAVDLSIVDEGVSKTYTVRMDIPVRREVTVTISSSARSKVQVSPETLTFMAGDWDAPQTVTADALEDNDYNDDAAVLTHRTSLTSSTFLLRVAVNDNDRRPNFVFDGSDSMAGNECRFSDVPEGASREYSLKLDGPPLENVVVSISSGAPGLVTPSATELTFTPGNWETAQAVTVTVGLGAPERAALAHLATGSGYVDRLVGRVIVSRDARPGFYFPLCDVPPVFTDVAECDVLVVPQGQSGSYGMRLRRQPASEVIVTVTHEGDSHVALKQTAGGEALATLEFTFNAGNWNVEQFAHFTAIDTGSTEEVADALVHEADGAGYEDQLVGRFIIRVVDRDRTRTSTTAP